MSLTVPQAFTKFLEEITATEHQRTTFIPNRKTSVDKDLKAGFPDDSDMPYLHSHLMGSAKKNTIIRPIDDIDLLAVFSDKGAYSKYRWSSQDFLYRIRKVYDGYKVQQVGARGQAVRVFYESGGHVDVAPVFVQSTGVYLLPAGDGTWITTAPINANEWYFEKNKTLSYQLTPLVRLLKAWNRAHSRHFRSFHLETVAAHTFSSLGSNYRDALSKFFQWAPGHLDVSDPGGQGGGSLSGYLTWGARQDLLKALSTAATRAAAAIKAEDDGDPAEAKRLWKIILGDDFPTS